MADRATAEKWLHQLTHLPTAPGIEDEVVAWVERWVSRRDDLRLEHDSGGNLLITQKGRKRKAPLLAVAHMDHPAFVITSVEGSEAGFEFRGGVTAPYFEDADVEVVSRPGGAEGRVVSYDASTQTGQLRITGARAIEAGDIAMFKMPRGRTPKGRFQAPACDDLAGAAAALAALDRCRRDLSLRHFGVLLTRAEEVGLAGAVHAARNQTVPVDARIISIETSRELVNARIGDGPVIRTGDRSTVFDRELTNRISRGAAAKGLQHQRKLMDGGGCEATAFGAYGYRSTGLCLCLGNWHNRGNLDAVERGEGEATPMLEEISLDDFHGLVDLLVLAATAVDAEDPLRDRLDHSYESTKHYLGL
jgi:putative aminopeptidase FrvX